MPALVLGAGDRKIHVDSGIHSVVGKTERCESQILYYSAAIEIRTRYGSNTEEGGETLPGEVR